MNMVFFVMGMCELVDMSFEHNKTFRTINKVFIAGAYLNLSLFYYALWFESFVQCSLINFEKKYTSSEVYYIY